MTQQPRRSSSLRPLLVAWCLVAAVVLVAWLLVPDKEPARRAVTARYERQPPAPPRVALDSPAAPVDSRASVSPVSSGAETVAALVSTSLAAERPQGTARVFGKVTARETGEAVQGVVLIVRDTLFHTWSAVSGPTGEYEIASLPAGTFWIAASSEETDVLGEGSPEPFALKEGEERRVDLGVTRAGRIWGTVTDEGGKPIPQAKVILGTGESIVTQVASMAAQQRQPLGALTDENGKYVVRGVPFEHEWVVWVDHDERAPVLSPPLVLHATRPQARVDVTLLAGTRITGHVLEPSRKPIPDAKVVCVPRYTALLAPMRKAVTARNAKTGEDGSFELTGVPSGDYQILAFKDGYRIELKGAPVYPDGRNPIEGVLVLLRTVADGDHVVFGSVRDGSGAPVAGAHVGLAAVGLDALSLAGRETETGADGAFRFEGVDEGEFLVVADKAGFRHAAVTANADREAKVELERCSGISGFVRRPDGTPAESFTVRVVHVTNDSSPDPKSSIIARLESLGPGRGFHDAEGRFELPDVSPGKVLLEASAPELAPARLEVELPRGQHVSDVVIRLSGTGAKIRGQVALGNGAPLKDAKVFVAEVGDQSGLLGLAADLSRAAHATTDEKGEFTVSRLAPAVYVVKIAHPDHAPATVGPVIAVGEETATVSAVVKDGGTIQGRAKPGAMITLAGTATSTMLAADEQGAFKLEHVSPGSYLLRAVSADDRNVARAPEVQRRSVRVEEGRTTSVDLIDDEAQLRTVSGRTTPPTKGSLAQVLLLLPGSPPVDPSDLVFQGTLGLKGGEASRYVVAEGLVAPDGTFALPGVPPGRYTQEIYTTSVLGTLTGQAATLKERKEIVVD